MSIRDDMAGNEVLIVAGEYENHIGVYTNQQPRRGSRNWIVSVAGKLVEYAPTELRTWPNGKRMPGVVAPTS